MSWFALQCLSGHEEKIAQTVAGWALPYRSYCPVQETRWVGRYRNQAERRVPLFAGYVFVDWKPPDDAVIWHRVMDLPGAISFIGGEVPTVIREKDLAEHIARTDERGVVRGIEDLLRRLKRGFGKGD